MGIPRMVKNCLDCKKSFYPVKTYGKWENRCDSCLEKLIGPGFKKKREIIKNRKMIYNPRHQFYSIMETFQEVER